MTNIVNHFRTLLMNVDGGAPSVGTGAYAAEEIVDPGYAAVALPNALRLLRVALFGPDPDRHLLNYRCRQLLSLVHASPLAEYVTALDPRITYGFDNRAVTTQWGVTATAARGVAVPTFLGTLEAPDAVGRVQRSYLITVPANNSVTVERLTPPYGQATVGVVGGQAVALPGSGLSFVLPGVTAPQTYTVDTFARPARDLAEVAAGAAKLGEAVTTYLFGLADGEPFPTFRQLWFRKKELPLRLGGLVCALAYRTDTLRKGGT